MPSGRQRGTVVGMMRPFHETRRGSSLFTRSSVIIVASVAVVLGIAVPSGAVTAPHGRVTGLIRLCGGPAPGRCFSQDGTAYIVLGPGHRVMASQKTQHARFSFSLPPGHYTVVAKTGGTRGQRPIVIKANQVLRANVVIAIR
jgi:hypothetical protein